ncbi:MAG: M20 family metallo-hydrolase [Rikenellaceae bacterium]|jgi:acetylornithine deacetylase|nr:M20 family metallo-hydrolase [Rikenellaceae bacterium]
MSAKLYNDAIGLLRRLVATPSFSREEAGTAAVIAEALQEAGVEGVRRSGNNVWVRNRHFDEARPTILLCSHHDTVRPADGWTRDPFTPTVKEGRLYGLGANDAGASVVALAEVFRHFYDHKGLKYNLILALVGEEEISGAGGVRSILPEIGAVDFAIVGEPTGMRLAVAERGLLVLDCVAHGVAGHAARNEGENAIYKAISDIEWFRTYRFPLVSPLLGEVKMSVTVISAGTQHNVVPAECRFTVDCRVNEMYTNEQVLAIVREHVTSSVTPRSTHLGSSAIAAEHPVVAAARELGLELFGSPTTSDQVALTVPSVKIGPGQSERSHRADEYVLLSEIDCGIDTYIELLSKLI